MTKVVVLSDVHWGGPWLSDEGEARVAGLLERARDDPSVREVVIAGDFLELELQPLGPQPPPSTRDILERRRDAGSPLFAAIVGCARAKRVTVVGGNHDHAIEPDVLRELLGVEFHPGDREPFFVLQSGTGSSSSSSTVAIAHGHMDDPLCVAVPLPNSSSGFAESVAYFLGRIGASQPVEAEAHVTARTPIPLSAMATQLVSRVRVGVPSETVLALAAKPCGAVDVLMLCLTAYTKHILGDAAVAPEARVECGGGRHCSWKDVADLVETQLRRLLCANDAATRLWEDATAQKSADAVWDAVVKLTSAFDPNLRPHAVRVARATGACAVVLGHSHIPLLETIDVDDSDDGDSAAVLRRVVYANDGAACVMSTHVEIDFATNEIALVDEDAGTRKVASFC